MACFWCHDVIAYFWLYDKHFDIMTNFSNFWRIFDAMTCCWCHHMFLTSWQTFWRYELLMLWRTCWGYDVMTISWQHSHNTQPNTSEWWCGQTLLGRYHVYPKAYTQPLYHSAYIDIFEIISAITKMYDTLWKKPLVPPSRMLANKHVLYLYFIYILFGNSMVVIQGCSFNQDSIRVLWDARCGHGCYSCLNRH